MNWFTNRVIERAMNAISDEEVARLSDEQVAKNDAQMYEWCRKELPINGKNLTFKIRVELPTLHRPYVIASAGGYSYMGDTIAQVVRCLIAKIQDVYGTDAHIIV